MNKVIGVTVSIPNTYLSINQCMYTYIYKLIHLSVYEGDGSIVHYVEPLLTTPACPSVCRPNQSHEPHVREA